ncbi:MAG: hypothetical protein QW568_03420 [Candidatus Anstonellaceae archaeon]
MDPSQRQLTDGVRERRMPDYVAKMPLQKGQWQKVGVAFFNPKTETFTVYFDVIPDKCKVVLFKN